jgi:spermidine synthase
VDPRRIQPAEVDTAIANRLKKPLRYWDGITHQHSFALPRFIRDAIAAETRVVTDAEPLIVT